MKNVKNIFLGSLCTLLQTESHAKLDNLFLKEYLNLYANDSLLQQLRRKGYTINVKRVGDRVALVIRAFICSVNTSQPERELLIAAVNFWNNQSGKYAYKLKSRKGEIRLPIYFELSEAPGIYNNQGFFIPASDISHQLITFLHVVPDERMQLLDQENEYGHTVGYVSNQFIYISDKYADNPIISIHEVGHTLGATHIGNSIMASEINGQMKKVKKKTIRDILKGGGLPVKGRIPFSHWNALFDTNYFVKSGEKVKAKIVKNKQNIESYITQMSLLY